MNRFSRTLAALACIVPMLAACDDTTAPEGTTSLGIMLTDAPGDLVSAVVTIEEVYLQGEGRVVLLDEPVTTDLLTLANDAMSLIDDVDVESGTYSDLRFVISGAYVEVEEDGGSTSIYATQGYDELPAGRTADGVLQTPSMNQSGLKVKFDTPLTITGAEQVLLIDFDVAQSFGHQAGNSGKWVMTPVIRGARMQNTSSVRVTLGLDSNVTLPLVNGSQLTLAGFNATLTDSAGNAKTAAFELKNGVYVAAFPYLLPETTWSLGIVAPGGVTITTDPLLPRTITTVSGQTDQAIVIRTVN